MHRSFEEFGTISSELAGAAEIAGGEQGKCDSDSSIYGVESVEGSGATAGRPWRLMEPDGLANFFAATWVIRERLKSASND